MKDTIDGFKKTMPLIMDLRNPAIRDRHWEQVMRECVATRSSVASDRYLRNSGGVGKPGAVHTH